MSGARAAPRRSRRLLATLTTDALGVCAFTVAAVRGRRSGPRRGAVAATAALRLGFAVAAVVADRRGALRHRPLRLIRVGRAVNLVGSLALLIAPRGGEGRIAAAALLAGGDALSVAYLRALGAGSLRPQTAGTSASAI